MEMAKHKWLSLGMTLVMFFISTSTAWAGLQQEIENSLICPACLEEGMLVATCPDSTAEQIRGEITAKIAAGETKPQILAAYVSQYGKQILSVPSTSGFDLMAWVTPFAAICAGGGVMYMAVNKWVCAGSRSTRTISQKQAARRMAEEEQYRERIEQEIKKYI